MLAFLMAAAVTAQLPSGASVPPVSTHMRQGDQFYSSVVVLTASNSGMLINCRAFLSGGSATRDKAICADFLGTTVTPAKTRDGVAVFSKIYVSVWGEGVEPIALPADVDLTLGRMPTGAPIHPRTKLAVTVDAQGQVIACDVTTSSGVPALDEVACKSGPSASQITAMKDLAGVPVLSVQPLIVSFGAYTDLVMAKKAPGARFSDPSGYVPDRARRLGVSGYANLACTATADGLLDKCAVDEEVPLGSNFGATALALAKDRWATVAPGAPGPVLVRVDLR